MDFDNFVNAFETIANAPGGVRRIREAILHLAVRGHLVAQEPADKPASELVAEIKLAKPAPTRRGSRRKVEPTAIHDDDVVPLRPGWCEVALDDVTEIVRGLTFPASAKSSAMGPDLMPCLRTTNVQDEVEWGDLIYVSREYLRDEAQIVRAGDLLMSTANSRELVGKVALVGADPPRAAFGGFLAAIRPVLIPPRFLQIVLRDPASKLRLVDSATQTTNIANISLGRLRPFRFWLPPLAEQERIVLKVDELLMRCDELESGHERRRRTGIAFRRSALNALAQAETPSDLTAAWERVNTNWRAITADSQSIAELREAILQLAVEGRLTDRSPNDGTVDKILEVSKSTALDAPDLVDADGAELKDPYPLPEGWRWVALGGVTSEILAGWSAPSTGERRSGEEWAVLKVSACSWGEFRPDENKALLPGAAPREQLEVKRGDFLISRANTTQLVARSVIVREAPRHLMLSDKTLRITLVDGCNPRYLNLANLASVARAHYEAEATGTSDSMKNVSQRAIRRTPIPLPPRAEQDRIVDAVERLNGLCDDIEQKLRMLSDRAVRVSMAFTA